mmetsp:Transcript_122884/g.347360  ORF Transcript_122884/g.347360 Transcript_122884/m.347360 type:complete len:209 (+) Transcript_122884:142-768(+)
MLYRSPGHAAFCDLGIARTALCSLWPPQRPRRVRSSAKRRAASHSLGGQSCAAPVAPIPQQGFLCAQPRELGPTKSQRPTPIAVWTCPAATARRRSSPPPLSSRACRLPWRWPPLLRGGTATPAVEFRRGCHGVRGAGGRTSTRFWASAGVRARGISRLRSGSSLGSTTPTSTRSLAHRKSSRASRALTKCCQTSRSGSATTSSGRPA